MNRQSRRWHQPAIELGRRDDPLLVKETRREFWDMRILFWSFDWRRHDGLKVLNHWFLIGLCFGVEYLIIALTVLISICHRDPIALSHRRHESLGCEVSVPMKH